jgi:parallel beta-helix repeat protein
MKPYRVEASTALLFVSALTTLATPHYVDVNGTNATPPYTNWATAATNIQDAVNVASAGDTLVVTNGVYPGGVGVNKPLRLLSLNGPQFTVINGGGTHRCVSLTAGASLTGFMLTNGYAEEDGGGLWCASTNGVVTNCLIVGNAAPYGGGAAYGGTLYNCIVSSNSDDGAWLGTLHNCIVSSNSGFGALGCTLYNCTLTGNARSGAEGCTLYNCTLTGNSGGGADGCTLYNCTLTSNSLRGAYGCTLYNCIVYFNTAASGVNYEADSALNYCCTTPLPTNGVGNIALDPQLASASHLSADSPCIGAGSAAYATGNDIDGEPWLNPPSIGCDEYQRGSATGPLTVSLVVNHPLVNHAYVAVGDGVRLTALIEGRPSDSVWDFGDGDVAINEPYITHSWTQPGDYLVALWAFNESHPDGVSATARVRVAVQPVLYVAESSTNPQPPYATWATAATSIQDAVNTTGAGGEIVVTNGVYPGGVTVTDPLRLWSVNGPQVTVINGGGTSRCVSLSDGASLTGFTLTNGFTAGWWVGGGVWCTSTNAFVTNCVMVGNSGGGAAECTLYNCTLTGNSGGGASLCTLYNCTLTGNSAQQIGGGAEESTLYNCTLTANSAEWAGGAADDCTLYNCTLTGNSVSPDANSRGGPGGAATGCTLYNCALRNNSASFGYGGGAAESTLYNCTLTGNSATGGGGAERCTLYNCILSSNSATSAFIRGIGFCGGAYNCVLNHCTLTANSAEWAGGGAGDCTLYSCTLTGNWASPAYGGYGGGAADCTLYNSVLSGNWAPMGGGAGGGKLYNCTVVDNLALDSGGGVDYSVLANCIVVYNAAWADDNYTTDATLNYCCTVPLPTNGVGNISVPPLFVDYASRNLRLQTTSPCINAGNNAYLPTTTSNRDIVCGCIIWFTNQFDMDGNPRIVSGTVDIGAYEYQGAGSRISYAWLQQFHWPINGSADFLDPDRDGMNNWQEWRCGTDPTNALSVLKLLAPTGDVSGVTVSWQSVTNRSYWLERATNLASAPAFSSIASNLAGQLGTTSYTDTTATNGGPFFYRVGVQP